MYVKSPPTLREAASSIADHGGRIALDGNGGTVTYRQLWSQIVGCAHWLVAQGVQHGDRVALVARNHVASPAVFWACQTVGAVYVPFSPHWTPDEVAYALTNSEPKVVFAETDTAAKLPASSTEGLVLIDGPGAGRMHGWDEVASYDRSAVLPDVEVSLSDLATIVYTSGTTGRPKGVVHTHLNHAVAIRNAALTSAAAEQNRAARSEGSNAETAEPVALHALPWFHVAGLGAICGGLLGGSTNLVVERWSVDEAVRLIDERGVTVMGGVPTMLSQVVAHVRDRPEALRSLRTVTSGASAVPPSLMSSLAERTQQRADFATGYGLTETTAAVVCIFGDDIFSRPGSIGYPYPVNEVRLVDDQMNEAAVGEAGEIWIAGPTVADGYWRDEAATARAFVEGGFRTGDLGRRDEDGYLSIVGRIKDVIIRGGENIQAAEVEGVIAELPEVMSVAVVGVTHPTLGEEVVAVVNQYPGAHLTPEKLDAACRTRLASFKVPARFVLNLEIPRNATGKALKSRLRLSLEADSAGEVVSVPDSNGVVRRDEESQ